MNEILEVEGVIRTGRYPGLGDEPDKKTRRAGSERMPLLDKGLMGPGTTGGQGPAGAKLSTIHGRHHRYHPRLAGA